MFKPISAGIAALAAAVAAVIPAGSASADDYDEKRMAEPGACVQASGWGVPGSYARAVANDRVVWRSNRHLHIYYSYGKAELRTCDRGELEDGGKFGLRHTWDITGTNVGSCNLRLWDPECTASDTREHATKVFTGSGWRTNVDGDEFLNEGALDVYALSDAGWLSDYYHAVKVRAISPSGNAESSTTVTIHFQNGGA